MKILHVVHGYPPAMGGSQLLIKNISEQLVTSHNDRVTVFTTVAYHTDHFWRAGTPTMPAGIETVNGVTVRRFKVFNHLNTVRMLLASVAYRLRLPYHDWFRTLYNGPIIFDLAQAVANSGAEIILAMAFPLLHMYYALAGARRAGIPIIFVGAIHAGDIWGYDRRMIYRAIQQADAYIALTTFERNYLIERGIPADKISVIGGGVDIDHFLAADGGRMRAQHLLNKGPVVATLGKQVGRKRFDILLQAMAQVWQSQPNAHLLIAGAKGSYSSQLGAAISALPPRQQAQVTVVSDFAETEKADILAACDIFVLPSGEESFGIAFVEAWACKKPVIGARIGAVSSLIEEGRDGLLFTYPDANHLAQTILSLLANPNLRHQLGEAGFQKVLKTYTWETIANQVRTVYVETVAQRST